MRSDLPTQGCPAGGQLAQLCFTTRRDVRRRHSRAPQPAMAHFSTCNACLKPIREGDVYITRCGHRFCERPRDPTTSLPPFRLAPFLRRARAQGSDERPGRRLHAGYDDARALCGQASARRAARRSTGRRISRCGARPAPPGPSCAIF